MYQLFGPFVVCSIFTFWFGIAVADGDAQTIYISALLALFMFGFMVWAARKEFMEQKAKFESKIGGLEHTLAVRTIEKDNAWGLLAQARKELEEFRQLDKLLLKPHITIEDVAHMLGSTGYAGESEEMKLMREKLWDELIRRGPTAQSLQIVIERLGNQQPAYRQRAETLLTELRKEKSEPSSAAS